MQVTPDQLARIVLGNSQVRDPGEYLLTLTVGSIFCILHTAYCILQEVDQQVLVRFVERELIDKADLARAVSLLPGDGGHATVLMRFERAIEQVSAVAWLSTQQEVHRKFLQHPNVWRVAGQAVLDHDDLQMRVFSAKFFQQSLGCVPLAVVLAHPVLLLNGFRRQRNDLLVIRMHEDRAQHLMLVGHFARLLIHLLQTTVAVNCGRGKIPRAVQGRRIKVWT